MKLSTLDSLVWVLIYGGLLTVGLGLSMQSGDAAWGWGLVGAGLAASALGVVLIYVRSRIKPGAGQ